MTAGFGQERTDITLKFQVKKYRWLVVRRTISLWSQFPNVVLEFDPEKSAYYVLSAEDTSDLAAIVTEEAHAIWEASEKLAAVPARVEGTFSGHVSYGLRMDSLRQLPMIRGR